MNRFVAGALAALTVAGSGLAFAVAAPGVAAAQPHHRYGGGIGHGYGHYAPRHHGGRAFYAPRPHHGYAGFYGAGFGHGGYGRPHGGYYAPRHHGGGHHW